MEIRTLLFGKISDLTGHQELLIHDVENTADIRNKMEEKYPDLKGMNYMIAVDKKLIYGDVNLQNDSEVALLPPFSGG